MAESKISQYPFSPEEQAELASLEETTDWQISFIESNIREMKLAEKILRRLQAGCKKSLVRTEDSTEPLRLEDVANFLAELTQCDMAMLARTVTARLQQLGIERRRPGRPTGRKADALYAAFVQVVKRAIEKTGVLAKKAELKKTRGSKWHYDFRHYLLGKGWPADRFDLVKTSTSPQELAIHIASEHFDRSYDRIYKALKASNRVKK